MFFNEQILAELRDHRKIVDIYREHIGADLCSGIITDWSKSLICVAQLDSNAHFDGLSIFPLEDITRMRFDHIEMFDKLSELILPQIDSSGVKLDNMSNALKSVYDKYGHVVIHTEDIDPDSCFIGTLISGIQDGCVHLHEFGTLSNPVRSHLVLSFDDVTRISGGGSYETMVAMRY